MTPFDPPGVDWTPVSPRLLVARRLGIGAEAVVATLVLVALAAWLRSPWWALAFTAEYAWVVSRWLVVGRQVRALGYAEREDDLLLRRGVLFRELVVVPYGRLQYVDVSAGPVDRWLGIARVQLHTASAHSDAAVPGLAPAEAARLRDRLAQRGEARLAGL